MADQFVAEIRMFAGNFAPVQWALCNGQILAISQNTALFSLLGTQFGGDGKTTFGLPNLQGNVPMDFGNGVGLTPRSIGEVGGEPSVTLLQTQMPQHNHQMIGAAGGKGGGSEVGDPTGHALAGGGQTDNVYTSSTPLNINMSPLCTNSVGGSQPHNNMMPYQCVTFIIALQGIFPARS